MRDGRGKLEKIKEKKDLELLYLLGNSDGELSKSITFFC